MFLNMSETFLKSLMFSYKTAQEKTSSSAYLDPQLLLWIVFLAFPQISVLQATTLVSVAVVSSNA